MTYFHPAPPNRAPLTEQDRERIASLEARNQTLSGYDRGELRALRMRAADDQGAADRIGRILASAPSAAQQIQDARLGRPRQ